MWIQNIRVVGSLQVRKFILASYIEMAPNFFEEKMNLVGMLNVQRFPHSKNTIECFCIKNKTSYRSFHSSSTLL